MDTPKRCLLQSFFTAPCLCVDIYISDCGVISWVDNNQSKQACKFGKTEGHIVLATCFGCQLDTRL